MKHFAKQLLITVMLLVMPLLIFSQIQKEVRSSRAYGPNLAIPGAFILTEDDKFSSAVAGLSNNAIIELGLNEDMHVYHSSYFKVKATFDVQLVSISSVTTTLTNQQLIIDYNPAEQTVYKDKAQLVFPNYYKARVYNVVFQVCDANLTNCNSNIHTDVYLDAYISTERLYSFSFGISGLPTTDVGSSFDVTNNELNVFWNFYQGATEYELEYTYVDDYDFSGGIPGTRAQSLITYDLKHDATRVITPFNNFKIPLNYERGYIVYRVRPIGRNANGDRLEGVWNSIPETGTIANLVATYSPISSCLYYTSAFQSDIFNWVSNKTFAEQGKSGIGLNYLDATGLSRQSIARLNFENKSIVQSTLFDHYSRPTYNMLPAPVDGLHFSYRTNLNKYYNGSSYVVFDNNIFDKCVGPCVTPNYVLDAANSNGATNYYSQSNLNKKSQQGFVPDAEGLAYTAIKYKADGSGRIIRQSMPGFTNKLGGKDIQYFYSNPSQVELDRLFGKEAGTQDKYTKNFVIDPNGQTSTSYIDMYGRTVATALLGDEPPGLLPLPNKTSAVSLTDNLAVSPTNTINITTQCIEVNTSFFVPGTNDQQVFNYATTLGTFLPAECSGNLCFDCVYNLEISIRSECDEEVFYDHDTNPLTPAIPLVAKIGGNENNLAYNCGIPGDSPNGSTIPQLPGYQIPNAPITIVFPKPGVYNIKKKLCISSDPLPSYLDQFINNGSCSNSFCHVADSIINELNLNSCAPPTCQQCLESIITYTNSHPIGTLGALTSQQIDNMVGNCNLLCPKTSCEKLKLKLMQDFIPNTGFFGATSIADPNWPYSVYNTGNSLGANSFASNNDYASPPLPYLNNQNQPASVIINSISYAPQLVPSMADFVNNFQLSWAASFLPLHPEYCKLKFQCEVIGTAYDYDEAMRADNHYEVACANGHLRPKNFTYTFGPNTTACTQVTDPVFSLGSPYTSLVSTLTNSLTTNYNNSGTNLYYSSANAVRGSSNMSGYVFGSDVCSADQEWFRFRDDYTSLKQDFYYNAFNTYTATYVSLGVGECVLNPANFPTGYTTVFDDDSDFLDYGIDPATQSNTATVAYQTSQCSTACNAYVPLWKSNLQNGCSAFNALTTTQQNALLTAMEAICNLGCDAEHPMGSSSTANSSIGYTIPSTSSVVHNFQEVLNYYGLTNCGSFLFSQPLPYDQSSYTAMTKLTDCKCDQLLQIENDYLALTTPIPGIDKTWKYFKYVYGFDLLEYNALLCACKKAIAPATWAPGHSWTTTQLTNLAANTNAIVDPKLKCKDCINCSVASAFLNSIYSTFPNHTYANAVAAIQNDPMNEQFAENALNQHFNVNYTIQDYCDLLNDCSTFNASSTIIHNINPQVKNLYNYLSDLLTNNLLTITHPMKVCTDQQYFLTTLFTGVLSIPLPTTYNYQTTVVGNNLQIIINNSAATPPNLCTINLTLPVGFTGGWPAVASFQSLQGYYPSPVAGPQYNFQIVAVDVNSNQVVINGTSCYSVTTLIGSPPMPAFCGHKDLTNPNQCQVSQINTALNTAQNIYDSYLIGLGAQFIQNYSDKCLAAAQEQFTRIYDLGEYNYTLYYYDQSGNLQRTVPPKGVVPLGITTNLTTNTYPAHSSIAAVNNNYVNDYRFNSLEEVLTENTVDGGQTIYFYDKAGRILASQNAKQKAMSGNVYSYTLYDVMGRVYEVGQVNLSSILAANNNLPINYDVTFINTINGGTKTEIVKTTYDDQTFDTAVLTAFGGAQNNLRNRVSYVTYFASISSIDHASFYSYDQHGNVQKIVQLNYKLQADFPSTNAGLKVIEYEYELMSGNMIKATYQKGTIESFAHKYWYDADNRLKEVFTSKDNINWDRDAKYIYYEHGPLARIERADKQVQGTDYFFTIHGWIKGVNSDALTVNADVGKDGAATNLYNSNYNKLHNYFAADAMGFGLNYYNAGSNVDFKAISAPNYNSSTYLNPVAGTAALNTSQFNLSVEGPALYNGNISSMVTTFIDKQPANLQTNNAPNPQITAYKYDQLHRIKQMKAFHNLSLNNWQTPTAGNYDDSYKMTFSYDENGNILSLFRNGAGSTIYSTPQLAMDDLNYKYFTSANGFGKNTNQLACLTDPVAASAFADDIDAPSTYAACLIAPDGVNAPYQSASSTRFKYDEVGNLISDAGEYIQNIEWTVDRKVKKVTRNATAMLATGTGPTSVYKADIEYEYNAMRQRVTKIVKPRDMVTKALKTSNEWLYTYYVYDAGGNVLATYDRSTNLVGATYQEKLKLAENHIYGSERLALAKPSNTLVQWQYNYPNCGSDPPTACRVSPPGVIIGLPAPSSPTYAAGRSLGYKEFELTNHLGNVITTVSDRKIQATYDPGTCVNIYDMNSGVPATIYPQNMTLAATAGSLQCTIQMIGISGIDAKLGTNIPAGSYLIEYDWDPGTLTLADGVFIQPFDHDGTFYMGSYFCNGSFVPPAGHYSFVYTPAMTGPAFTTYVAFYTYAPISNHYFKIDNLSMCPINAPAIATSYTADLLMHTDYYAFGQEMPGRKWAASNYRYGMNGQEKEDALYNGAHSAEYWMFDARLGRRWETDPFLLAWQSPYSTMANSPILNNDPNGDIVKADFKTWIQLIGEAIVDKDFRATLIKEMFDKRTETRVNAKGEEVVGKPVKQVYHYRYNKRSGTSLEKAQAEMEDKRTANGDNAARSSKNYYQADFNTSKSETIIKFSYSGQGDNGPSGGNNDVDRHRGPREFFSRHQYKSGTITVTGDGNQDTGDDKFTIYQGKTLIGTGILPYHPGSDLVPFTNLPPQVFKFDANKRAKIRIVISSDQTSRGNAGAYGVKVKIKEDIK